MDKPTEQQLIRALEAAGGAHHDYQARVLNGEPDPAWPGWYAAYALGRLGDFMTASHLTSLLADIDKDAEDWNRSAAELILDRLS